jgi:CubicO group peptidase (beta-lactamase class C family)
MHDKSETYSDEGGAQMKNKMKSGIGMMAGIIVLFVTVLVVNRFKTDHPPQVSAPDYWPTNGWRANAPEEQGLDSIKLAEGLRSIQGAGFPIHSLMIVRNGYVVLEASFYPYDGKSPHNVGSVTKSVLTTLIGIAVDQGKLDLENQMLSFFPNQPIANRDHRKDRITVRNLVSMTSGLDCTGLPSEATVQEMEASVDWVKFMLDRPMASEPGSTFVYCGGNMHLLSAILQKATGMTALEYARKNLFEPLGFHEVIWPTDPQGVNQGSGNIRLFPADMARLGFLFLHNGLWDGRQVVSQEWVRNAVRPQSEAGSYGYGWWVSTGKTGSEFNADGAGGQHIAVVPGLNLVLVTTGGGFNVDEVVPYLSPALVDMSNPLPANPMGVSALNLYLAQLAESPLPQPVALLPDTATRISGKIFEFDSNPLQLQEMQLDFDRTAGASIQFAFTDGSQSPQTALGLDGIYRMTSGVGLDRAFRTALEWEGVPAGMRGAWTDEHTLVIDYDTITNRYAYQLQMGFEKDGVTVVASDRIYGTSVTIHGTLRNPSVGKSGLTSVGQGQLPEISQRKTVPVQPGLTDPRELQSFLDGIITDQLSAYHLPGASVAVVKDGEVFFAKGYGYANIAEQIPVLADQTLFRPGSITKLFTWTAIMQLAEQGKVDLNANINIYLKGFQIPNTYPHPITLANLLTHTSGLEDRGEGLYVRNLEDMLPLSDYAARYLPARIRPPGELMGYSNYGAGLAGYVIEAVSGMPYEKYVEKNILNPLGMTHSTLLQPPPTELAESRAIGYKYAEGVYLPTEEWIQAKSTGALSATATDMAKFMIAHLQDGQFGNGRILQEKTAQDMHRQHFTQDARAGGWTYGFMEMELNGQRIIWHGGATLYFHSALFLLPEQNIGLFVSYNSQGGMPAHAALIRAFMDRYYPATAAPVPQPAADFTARASRFTGIYRGSNHQNETGLEKMLSLSSEIPLTLTPNGTLKTVGVGFGWPAFTPISQWVQTEDPLVFIRVDGGESLIFQEDQNGKIVSFIVAHDPQAVYLKKTFFDTSGFTLPVAGVCLLFCMVSIVTWLIRYIISRRERTSTYKNPWFARLARWLAGCFGLLSLFFVVAFLGMMTDPEIIYGAPPALKLLLACPLVMVILTACMLALTGVAWVRHYWRISGRIHYTLLTLAALAFLGWLQYWNLIFAFFKL